MSKASYIGLLLLFMPLCLPAQEDQSGSVMTRARYQVSVKAYEQALETLKNLPADADPALTALVTGKALSGLTRLNEANRWLEQVTGALEPEASYLMAKNFAAMRNFTEAARYLGKHLQSSAHQTEKSIRLDPAFAELENSREWIRVWQGDWYSESEQQVAECEYLIVQDQLDEAAALAEQRIASGDENPGILLALARIHQLRKADRPFRQTIDRAWQLARADVRIKEKLLELAIAGDYQEKANTMVTELIRIDPTNPDYRIMRAMIRMLGASETNAVRELEALESAGITPTELYYQVAWKLSESQPRQAEQYLNQAIDSGPLDDRFFFARAKVRQSMNKPSEALDDFAMSLDINPNQPELYLIRGQLRLDLGDTDGACHDWQKAVDLGNAKATDLLYKNCRLP